MSVVALSGKEAIVGQGGEDFAKDYEDKHVHKVYEVIAPHFSATRFKPWPIVERFLSSRPDGSVGLDIGCGNGKYLGINPKVFIIGSDRSSNLVRIARKERGQEVLISDALDLPHPLHRFDFAISIAVIHHFSSRERRVSAVKSILSTLKRSTGGMQPTAQKDNGKLSECDRSPTINDNSSEGENVGKALIYVWALEQKNSRRGWDENSPQDVFVPWVMQKRLSGETKAEKHSNTASPESKSLGNPSVVPITQKAGSSKDVSVDSVSGTVPETRDNTGGSVTEKGEEPPVFMRYYHLYRKGELEEDVQAAGGIVCESGYEKDNWWAIIKAT